MGTNDQNDLLDNELDIEKGFNDALDDLRKSLGENVDNDLNKAKKDPVPPKKDDEDEGEMDDEGEEDDEGEDYRKSIEDILQEDPEASAAMDVEPFLLQLAKAIDESMEQLNTVVSTRLGGVEKLVKSIGNATLAAANLQKSTNDMIEQIGHTSVPSGSLRSLRKARFEGDEGSKEYDPRMVLAKSREWVQTGKINLTEAGNIEGRINKGALGARKDALDMKVAALMNEEVK